MVPRAPLRVFRAIGAFEPAEQAHWERYLIGGTGSPSLRPKYRDRPYGGSVGLIAPADGEHAEVRIIEGHTFVSPWRLRLQILAATVAFADDKPLELSERFLPKREAA